MLQNAAAAIGCLPELWALDETQSTKAFAPIPACPTGWSGSREKDGVLFVNDSKATNPTATAPALAAFPKIRWILGGQAKTDNLDECAPHFGHVRKAYTIGEAGEMFASLLSPHMAVAECVTLGEAVKAAASEAEAGDTVLLSPACASFDQFRDFEARGRCVPRRWWGNYEPDDHRQDQGQRRLGRPEPLRPVRPLGRRPLVLGDRPGAAAAAGGADRRRADRGRGGQPGGGAALFGRIGARSPSFIISTARSPGSRLSMPVMIAISMQPRERLRRLSLVGALVCLVALALVPWLGAEVNGAKRWLNLGVGQFQPSEFLKPFFVVSMAWLLSLREEDKSLPIFTLSAAITAAGRVPADAPAGLRLDHHLRRGVDRDAGHRRAQPAHPRRARHRRAGRRSCSPISSTTWRRRGSTPSSSARATISRPRMRCAR